MRTVIRLPISAKQKKILAFPYTNFDALIADGAIRSGKTVFITSTKIKGSFPILLSTVTDTLKSFFAGPVSLSLVKLSKKEESFVIFRDF